MRISSQSVNVTMTLFIKHSSKLLHLFFQWFPSTDYKSIFCCSTFSFVNCCRCMEKRIIFVNCGLFCPF